VPDFIPVLGRVDDAILVPLGILIATRLMPPEVLDEHRRRAAILAEAPTDWRVGAAAIVFCALDAALVARWLIVFLTERNRIRDHEPPVRSTAGAIGDSACGERR
jgi:hypothetical protein